MRNMQATDEFFVEGKGKCFCFQETIEDFEKDGMPEIGEIISVNGKTFLVKDREAFRPGFIPDYKYRRFAVLIEEIK